MLQVESNEAVVSPDCPKDKPYTLPGNQECVADCGPGGGPRGGSKQDQNECMICSGKVPYFIRLPPWMAPACVAECPDGFSLHNVTLHCEADPLLPKLPEVEAMDEATSDANQQQQPADAGQPVQSGDAQQKVEEPAEPAGTASAEEPDNADAEAAAVQQWQLALEDSNAKVADLQKAGQDAHQYANKLREEGQEAEADAIEALALKLDKAVQDASAAADQQDTEPEEDPEGTPVPRHNPEDVEQNPEDTVQQPIPNEEKVPDDETVDGAPGTEEPQDNPNPSWEPDDTEQADSTASDNSDGSNVDSMDNSEGDDTVEASTETSESGDSSEGGNTVETSVDKEESDDDADGGETVDEIAPPAHKDFISLDLLQLGVSRLPGENTIVTAHNCTKLYAARYDGTCVSQCPPNMEPKGYDSVCMCDAAHPYIDLNVPLNNQGSRTFEACVSVCPQGEAPTGGNGTEAAHCVSCASGTHLSSNYTRPSEGKPYSFNNKCVSICPPGAAPNSNNACLSCVKQSNGEQPYAEHATHKCVSDCPSGKVPKGGKYESWDTREKDPGAFDCIECPEGKFADHTAQQCVPECPAGSIEQEQSGDCVPDIDLTHAQRLGESSCPDATPYFHEDACVAVCPAGMAPNSNSTCTACNGDFPFSDHRTHTCVSTCRPGHAPSAEKDCTVCNGTTPYADKTTQTCVAQCQSGEAPNDLNDCSLCTGEKPYATDSGCADACPAGQAPDTSNTCVVCNGDTPYANKLVEGNHKCTARCPPASTPDSNNDCQTCDSSAPFADHATGQCVSTCGEGEGPNPVKDCAPCGSQTPFANHDINRCVSDCPPGMAPNENKDCTKCDDPKPYADHVAHKCVDACPQDYKVGDHEDCVPDVLDVL